MTGVRLHTASASRRLTRQQCLDRAGLYEEAAAHLEQCWDGFTKHKNNLDYVVRHLHRELERWEVRAASLPDDDRLSQNTGKQA